jgi:hypothetical protein
MVAVPGCATYVCTGRISTSRGGTRVQGVWVEPEPSGFLHRPPSTEPFFGASVARKRVCPWWYGKRVEAVDAAQACAIFVNLLIRLG